MIPPGVLTLARQIGWRGGAIILLGAGCAIQTVRLNITDAHLEACEAGRKADRAAVVAAQAEARTMALQDREKRENKSREQARFTDEQLLEARQDGIDWANDHNRRNRVRPEALAGLSGGTVAAPGDSDTGSGNGTDPAPVMDAFTDPVIVEAQDVVICTDVVLRLEAVQAWAEGLNAE